MNLPIPSTTLSSFAFRAIGFAQFGGIGDGSTDNSAALNAFGNYARAESAVGRGVELHIPPGIYNYDASQCFRCLYSIQKLRIVGYGTAFQNTYNQSARGANFGYELPFPSSCAPNLHSGIGPQIKSTAIGDITVTLKKLSDHSQFAVGDWVMVSSLDIQYYGYPPNCDQFDFVKITVIDMETGIITFDPPLRYAHRDDFPDGGNVSNPCGKARIWQLNSAPTAGGTWDLEHIYEGVSANKAPTSSLTYISFSGRSIKIIDCTLPGISPTVCGRFEMIGGVLTDVNEPDKLVGSVLIDGTDVRNGIVFQSSSIDRVTLRNGRGGIQTGMAKSALVQNWDAQYLTQNAAQDYGQARNLLVEASIIRRLPYFHAFQATSGANIIDGTNVLFSNGTFAVLKSFSHLYAWNMVPGGTVNLSGPNGIYTGDIGNGIVTSVYEDSSYVYFETTLPYAKLPSWANGDIRLQRNGNSTYINCHGCDEVLGLSEAGRQGKRWWEFFTETFAGKTARSNGFLNDPVGNLTRLKVNVVQPSTIANTVLNVTCKNPGAYSASTMANPLSVLIEIDATVTGVRDFTQTALTGKATNDAVKLSGVTQTTLPVGYWYPGFSWRYSGLNPASHRPSQLPIIEIMVECDAGYSRRLVAVSNLAT